jgi:hypothetical protein
VESRCQDVHHDKLRNTSTNRARCRLGTYLNLAKLRDRSLSASCQYDSCLSVSAMTHKQNNARTLFRTSSLSTRCLLPSSQSCLYHQHTTHKQSGCS